MWRQIAKFLQPPMLMLLTYLKNLLGVKCFDLIELNWKFYFRINLFSFSILSKLYFSLSYPLINHFCYLFIYLFIIIIN